MAIRYDPAIIQRYADTLYSRANAIIFAYTILGAGIGGFGGWSYGRDNGPEVQKLMAIFGAGVAGLIGFIVGLGRAFWLKLQAQLALCQKRIEENTRR